jgi:hypothetical protein
MTDGKNWFRILFNDVLLPEVLNPGILLPEK